MEPDAALMKKNFRYLDGPKRLGTDVEIRSQVTKKGDRLTKERRTFRKGSPYYDKKRKTIQKRPQKFRVFGISCSVAPSLQNNRGRLSIWALTKGREQLSRRNSTAERKRKKGTRRGPASKRSANGGMVHHW